MGKTAVVFPGQGSQRRGMALDFARNYREAQELFVRASKIVPFDILKLCREGSELLDLTEYTQPSILTVEIVIYKVLHHRFGFRPAYFAGHSLGEYAALVAARAISFEDALKLVLLRAKLMQGAMPPGEGGMVAIKMNRLSSATITGLAERRHLDIASENSSEQIVLSGMQEDLKKFTKNLLRSKQDNIKLTPLYVSAPFHSHYMNPTAREFKRVLESILDKVDFDRVKRVTSNYTGCFHSGNKDDFCEALSKQISSTVKWKNNMEELSKVADRIIEVGPNRPLRGFFQSMGVKVPAVIDVRSAKRVFLAAGG